MKNEIEMNDNHRRTIGTSLWLLDEMLCVFERWITHHESHSLLFDEVNTLTNQDCDSINHEIISMRALLKQMKDDLNIHSHRQLISRSIEAMSRICISDTLESLQGGRLDAYGTASMSLIQYLSPKISELIERLETVCDISSICANRDNNQES